MAVWKYGQWEESQITLGEGFTGGRPACTGSLWVHPEMAAVFPVRVKTQASAIAEGTGLNSALNSAVL